MENSRHDVNVHIGYCTPCGGKAFFDKIADAIQENVPSAKVMGEEDHRSGAFEVTINGKNVHSRLQTLMYPDVSNTVEVVEKISLGEPIPKALAQTSDGCIVS